MLPKLQRTHPHDIELVSVSTDSIERCEAIETRLQRMKMDGYSNRTYAEATPERLNFLLDSNRGGETPHVLLIRPAGYARRCTNSAKVRPY